jgi:hypothetical protein
MGKHIVYTSLAKPSKHIVGSGFAGHLTCSYQHLVNCFGEPMLPTDGYKTSAEWHIEITHDDELKGVVAIYDYKQCKSYSRDGLDTEDITEWHLGAKSNWLAADLLHFIKHPKTQEQAISHVQ